ncbi:hypothetical protein ACTRW9_01665 [Nitrospina sp. 32_T5]|uniref:hypothetical protein n=1 Tax=unclassified Nitrospina TaxID=2638683 RepID=UPI003F9888CB
MQWLKFTYWKEWWFKKPETERKRLKSFIPLVLYTFGFVYFVIYLSILNSVNRYKTGDTVKSWFGGDRPELVKLKEEQEREIEKSYKALRKQVSGGR